MLSAGVFIHYLLPLDCCMLTYSYFSTYFPRRKLSSWGCAWRRSGAGAPSGGSCPGWSPPAPPPGRWRRSRSRPAAAADTPAAAAPRAPPAARRSPGGCEAWWRSAWRRRRSRGGRRSPAVVFLQPQLAVPGPSCLLFVNSTLNSVTYQHIDTSWVSWPILWKRWKFPEEIGSIFLFPANSF